MYSDLYDIVEQMEKDAGIVQRIAAPIERALAGRAARKAEEVAARLPAKEYENALHRVVPNWHSPGGLQEGIRAYEGSHQPGAISRTRVEMPAVPSASANSARVPPTRESPAMGDHPYRAFAPTEPQMPQSRPGGALAATDMQIPESRPGGLLSRTEPQMPQSPVEGPTRQMPQMATQQIPQSRVPTQLTPGVRQPAGAYEQRTKQMPAREAQTQQMPQSRIPTQQIPVVQAAPARVELPPLPPNPMQQQPMQQQPMQQQPMQQQPMQRAGAGQPPSLSTVPMGYQPNASPQAPQQQAPANVNPNNNPQPQQAPEEAGPPGFFGRHLPGAVAGSALTLGGYGAYRGGRNAEEQDTRAQDYMANMRHNINSPMPSMTVMASYDDFANEKVSAPNDMMLGSAHAAVAKSLADSLGSRLIGDPLDAVRDTIKKRYYDEPKWQRNFDDVVKGDPMLSKAHAENPTLLVDAFSSVKRFSPSLAKDRLATRNLLKHVVMSGGEMDHSVMKMLAETEKAVTQSKQRPL